MNGTNGESRKFDLMAVGMGVIWGLVVLIGGALVQTVIGLSSPLSTQTIEILTLVWQILAGLLGGMTAARRADTAGWLHGAVSGAALVLSIAAVMGVAQALPTLAVLLKMAGIGVVAGTVGGIAGVNLGRR
ncbi:MAG: TIGR04086 family membrane protein [Mycobacterium leprae]